MLSLCVVPVVELVFWLFDGLVSRDRLSLDLQKAERIDGWIFPAKPPCDS